MGKEEAMKITEIRERCRGMRIAGLARMHKGDMIRAIQRAEGNADCFGAPWRFDCMQIDCCWREDCRAKTPG